MTEVSSANHSEVIFSAIGFILTTSTRWYIVRTTTQSLNIILIIIYLLHRAGYALNAEQFYHQVLHSVLSVRQEIINRQLQVIEQLMILITHIAILLLVQVSDCLIKRRRCASGE